MKTHDVSSKDFINYCNAHGLSKKDSRKFLNLFIEFTRISMENDEVFTIQKLMTIRMREFMYTATQSVKVATARFTKDFRNKTNKW